MFLVSAAGWFVCTHLAVDNSENLTFNTPSQAQQ